MLDQDHVEMPVMVCGMVLTRLDKLKAHTVHVPDGSIRLVRGRNGVHHLVLRLSDVFDAEPAETPKTPNHTRNNGKRNKSRIVSCYIQISTFFFCCLWGVGSEDSFAEENP